MPSRLGHGARHAQMHTEELMASLARSMQRVTNLNRYDKVVVLHLTWDYDGLERMSPSQELQDVFEQYGYETRRVELRSGKDDDNFHYMREVYASRQLEDACIDLAHEFKDDDSLIILHYSGLSTMSSKYHHHPPAFHLTSAIHIHKIRAC